MLKLLLSKDGGPHACVIVEQQGPASTSFLCFRPGQPVLVGEERDFLQELNDPSTLYLIDGRGARANAGSRLSCFGLSTFVMVFVSPEPSFYTEFVKEFMSRKLYMPMWELNELLDLHRLLYPRVLPADVKELFVRVGGVPRLVLEHANSKKDTFLSLDQAITRADILGLFHLNGKLSSDDSNKIVHMRVRELESEGAEGRRRYDFEAFDFVYASSYVQEAILQRGLDEAQASLLALMCAGSVDEHIGHLFEALAHKVVGEKGGTFPFRWLDGNAKAPLPSSARGPVVSALNDSLMLGVGGDLSLGLARPDRKERSSALDILQPGTYWRPDSGTFPVIDAAYHSSRTGRRRHLSGRRPGVTILLQYSVSPSRILKDTDVAKVKGWVTALGLGAPVLFLFVTPSENLKGFSVSVPDSFSKSRLAGAVAFGVIGFDLAKLAARLAVRVPRVVPNH